MKPLLTLTAIATLALTPHLTGETTGWLNWRGPLQTGASLEKELPSDLKIGNELWTFDVQGAGTPTIADGRLYAFGFYGEKGEDTQEALICLDADTGKLIWEKRFSDYISDVVYNRYAVGAPTIDPETGNVYLQLSNGRCVAFTRDGEQIWEISLMEELSRLTFPNGRSGAPAVFNHLVIFHCVTANWGLTGPARDRFYAFDKVTGELVWYSSPGIRPVDSSFSMPVFGKLDGHDVFYAGVGCGNVVCVDANTGKPLWRYQLSNGGVNSQILLNGDQLIAIHGKENPGQSSKGRLICLNLPKQYPAEQLVLDESSVAWKNDDHVAFTSSPVLAEGKLFTTISTGELVCVDAESGKTQWKEKLAPDQIHASPTYGDGKLYVPMFDGEFYVLDPEETGAKQLAKIKTGEACLGAPAIWGGKIYLFTKTKLHCWGTEGSAEILVRQVEKTQAVSKLISSLQIVPAEFALRAGGSQSFKVFGLDAKGQRIKEVSPESWEAFIPPTARVKAKVDATFEGSTLTAGPDAKLSAGAFKATVGDLSAHHTRPRRRRFWLPRRLRRRRAQDGLRRRRKSQLPAAPMARSPHQMARARKGRLQGHRQPPRQCAIPADHELLRPRRRKGLHPIRRCHDRRQPPHHVQHRPRQPTLPHHPGRQLPDSRSLFELRARQPVGQIQDQAEHLVLPNNPSEA